MWALLSEHRVFRRLWAAATVDALGTWLLVMAVPVQIYAVTGSETSTAVALAVQAVPALVIGPWAGALVDRWSRRSVFIAANVLAAAGVGLIATGPVELIYAGLVAESAAACFLRPALQATVPQVVPGREARAAANALLAVSHSVLRIGAPLAGTALTAAGWFTVVVAIDAASYLIAALMLTSLSCNVTERAGQTHTATERRHTARTATPPARQRRHRLPQQQTCKTTDLDPRTQRANAQQRATRTVTARERTTHVVREDPPPTHNTTNRDPEAQHTTDQPRPMRRTPTARGRTTQDALEQEQPTHNTADRDPQTRNATDRQRPTRSLTARAQTTHHASENETPTHNTTGRAMQTRDATDQPPPARNQTDRKPPTHHPAESEPPTHNTTNRNAQTGDATDQPPPARNQTDRKPPTHHPAESKPPTHNTTNRDAQTDDATDRQRPTRERTDRNAPPHHADGGEPPNRASGGSRAAVGVWDGWLIVMNSRLLGGMLAGSFIFWAANAALTAMLVPFVAHRLHGDGVVVGQLAMGLGAGYLGGSFLSRTLLVRWAARTLLAGSYGAVGVCFLVLFGSASTPVAVIAITAAGVPGAVAAVATSHHLQSATPDHARGRVAATFQTSDAAAAVVGALAGAALAGAAGAPLLLSALVLVASVLTAVLLRPVGSAGGRAQDRRTRGAVV
uniref:MFS transporter n=1 Tax=Paractinoplanes polyasparticus TaxID=2856853 RepID=UPI001C85DDD3|nr:MFS transporter [Actinoplanes polyasparticus]